MIHKLTLISENKSQLCAQFVVMRRLHVKQNAETKSRRCLSANQKLTHIAVLLSVTKVRLYLFGVVK